MSGDASNAPVPLELSGKKYMLSPLERGDYKKFLAWVVKRHLDIAREACQGMEIDVVKTLMDNARKEAGEFTWVHRHVLEQMTDLEGSTFLIWLGLVREQSDVTLEKVCDLLSDPANHGAAMSAFDDVEGLQESKKKLKRKPVRKKRLKPATQKRKRGS